MTIRRGAAWGEAATAPADAPVAASDAEVAAAPNREAIVVTGGDLLRTLGGGGPATTLRVPVDLLRVGTDAGELSAAAHVVARRAGRIGWWRGPVLAVMNVEFVGAWDVAPRAHPNDGWADVVEVGAAMSVRARWQARRRLHTGTHLPHPAITTRRIREAEFSFERPMAVWIDGAARGTTTRLTVEVLPDAATVYI